MNSGRNADMTGSYSYNLVPLSSLDELNYSEIMVHECHQLLFATGLLLWKCSKRTVTQWFIKEALYQVNCDCHYCVYWLHCTFGISGVWVHVFLLLNQCYALCHARKQSNMTHWLTGIIGYLHDVDSELTLLWRHSHFSVLVGILQHIGVLADHDRKYCAISCSIFCSRCPPPVPSH